MGCSQSIIRGGSIDPLAAEKGRRDGSEGAEGELAFGLSSASCKKMLRGLSLVLSGRWPERRRRRRRRRGSGAGKEERSGSENNRSWLLADARGEAAEAEPSSVHSSFRFSFGSQAEAEELPGSARAPAATVLLLVNLEDEGEGAGRREGEGEGEGGAEARSRELLLWRRMESLERSISPVAGGLVRFSYADVRSATRDFSKGRELGRGALSRVYRGRIGAGRRAVAIKMVEGQGRESAKAFCRELMIASSLHHSNVVPLLGFCNDLAGLFLVYKYVSGGSLDHHLQQHEKRSRRKVLSWEVRYNVAVGVARAVEYLHFGTDKCVVHRDIKPSNILLSSKKTPKLCDFGLATWTHGPSLPFLCKSVKGTFGYLAPEYFQHGKLSDKTDVYAFGVVLLELITGRKAIDQSRPQGDANLVVWAKPLLQQGEEAIEKFVDPRLKPRSYRRNEMNRMVRTAAACINSEESGRPSIDQVIGMLQTEEEECNDWSFLADNGCLAGYGSQHHESLQKRDMKGHLALAMLGVSDTEEDDPYNR